MTPEEKAREIIEMFAPAMPNENWRDRAIQCALIHVDGLIKEAIRWQLSYMGNQRLLYWLDVKKEIENL